MLNAQNVSRDAIPVVEHPVRFDFVQSASRTGTAFQLEGGGHFVIAPNDSLIPRFVVELSLPTLGDVEYYNSVIQTLNAHSCGFMWFDDNELHAFDVAWRMRLPLIAVSVLFAVKQSEKPAEREGFELRPLGGKAEHGPLNMLLTALPTGMGGLTTEQANQLLSKGDVTVLAHEGSPVGVIVSSTLPSGDLYAHAFSVAPEFQGKGLGTWFMHLFTTEVAKGRSVIFGVPNFSHAEFRGALKLGAKIINRGWRAQLGSI
jgi:hypothetical protein